MKLLFKRLLQLHLGLFICSIGIVFTINANIGYAPWEIFHSGLSKTFNISIGIASIFVGVAIVIITYLLGEKLGFGTLANMVYIGLFIDLIMHLDFIPHANGFLAGLMMLIIGVYIISIGSYFYISSAFGAGPRDSLMIVMQRKTGLSVGVCRGTIELSAALLGWRLGGMLGLGTLIAAFATGYFIQITFKMFKFNPTQVNHEILSDTYQSLNLKKAA